MASSNEKLGPAAPFRRATDPPPDGRIEARFPSTREPEWRPVAEADLDAAPDSPDLYKAALSDPRRH